MKAVKFQKLRRGWLLMEVLMAMAVFSLAAIGLVAALRQTAKLSNSAQETMRITRLLDTALRSVRSDLSNNGNTEVYEFPVEELNTIIYVYVKDIKLENQDGKILKNNGIQELTAEMEWVEDGENHKQQAKTWWVRGVL